LLSFLNSASAETFAAQRNLVSTRSLANSEAESLVERLRLSGGDGMTDDGAIFEHERIFFPSYPYEWPVEMLHAAALLTLELIQKSATEGFGLKDATPYNILFRGVEPVFVDLLSFERRDPRDPVWKPYAQFVRTFLLPLLVHKYWSRRLSDIFLTHRDGLEPEEVYRMCGFFRRFRPTFLSLVSLPVWLSGKGKGRSLYETERTCEPEKARFILELLFRRLHRAVVKLDPDASDNSHWSGYMGTHSYTAQGFGVKEHFVEDALNQFRPKRLLDIGANTGHFSALAASRGMTVVAIDSDPACVGALWKEATRRKLNILPLVVDLSRPSPAVGWRNGECPGFLDRARGSFDCVLMLALLHHLLVNERIPLPEVFDLAAEITTDTLIIEYVGPEDSMFKTLARGRSSLFSGLTRKVFEAAAQRKFRIINSTQVPDAHRWLYLLQKKSGDSAEICVIQ
jgi:hypothetical protein